MKLLAGFLTAMVLACSVALVSASDVPGRYKLDGDGNCYWDENDEGEDQCSPGRLKLDGNGGCYWLADDLGPDQCEPAISEARFWAYVELIGSIPSEAGVEEVQAIWSAAHALGLVEAPPEELAEVISIGENPEANGGGLTCTKKNQLIQKATSASNAMLSVAGGLVIVAGIAGFFGAAPVAGAALTAGAISGVAAAGMSNIAGALGSLSCS